MRIENPWKELSTGDLFSFFSNLSILLVNSDTFTQPREKPLWPSRNSESSTSSSLNASLATEWTTDNPAENLAPPTKETHRTTLPRTTVSKATAQLSSPVPANSVSETVTTSNPFRCPLLETQTQILPTLLLRTTTILLDAQVTVKLLSKR